MKSEKVMDLFLRARNVRRVEPPSVKVSETDSGFTRM